MDIFKDNKAQDYHSTLDNNSVVNGSANYVTNTNGTNALSPPGRIFMENKKIYIRCNEKTQTDANIND